MFTLADIRNIAIQIEKNGEASYRQAAKSVTDDQLAEAFERMADEEKRHAEWFAALETDKELTEEQREMEEVGKTILQEMVKDRTFSLEQSQLEKVENFQELVRQSKGFEQDTILFYEMLSGFIDDEESAAKLNVIIAEEKRHMEELEELLGRTAASSC